MTTIERKIQQVEALAPILAALVEAQRKLKDRSSYLSANQLHALAVASSELDKLVATLSNNLNA